MNADELRRKALDAGRDLLAAEAMLGLFSQGTPEWDAVRELVDSATDRVHEAIAALAKVQGYGDDDDA
jgi:hypothetical protein